MWGEIDRGMHFVVEMKHGGGGLVEHHFKADGLDDVLMHLGYFVRGCGFVVGGTESLEFVPEDDARGMPDHDGELPDKCEKNRDGTLFMQGIFIFREERLLFFGIYLPRTEMLDEIEVWYKGVEIYNLLADDAEELIQRKADWMYRNYLADRESSERLRAED
jgi:hypothetical protein